MRCYLPMGLLGLVGCLPPPPIASLSDVSLSGTGEADRLVGTPGRDVIAGGAGRDELFGGAGDDLLWGGPGTDRLTGGPGADVFALDATTLQLPDLLLDFDPGERDRILLLEELVDRLPEDLEKHVRVSDGALEVLVQQHWVAIARGLEDDLVIRFDPRGRAMLLSFRVRF